MDCLVIHGPRTGACPLDFPRPRNSKMGDDDAAREDARREYQSSLEDLTFNSKPHINMLTILAEENLHFAKDIVAIIEAQISKAPSSEKLPVLYLVDSIVKNVGGEYLAVFAKNLVTSFICVFEKVDENIRKSLFKLRSTWDDVFPLPKLYALDIRVNSQDTAWPVKPLPAKHLPASIHVNPKFLKQAEDAAPRPKTPQPLPAPVVAAPAPAAPAVSEASLTQEQLIRQQLLAKQKQLLELQQKKIELELEQTKAQLAGGFVLTPAVPQPSVPAVCNTVPKATIQPSPAVRPWTAPNPVEVKPPTRDPRLNRCGPPASKEHSTVNKDGNGPSLTPEKRHAEKSSKGEKMRMPKKGTPEEKPKSPSKSPSPMPKGVPGRGKHSEADGPKTPETGKKDPRLQKRPREKPGEDDQKEKKRFGEKKEKEENPRVLDPTRSAKSKLPNGSLSKHEMVDSTDASDFKSGGNARTNARKRTRSRSRSSSPKRKDRRSPKGRARSTSSSPSPAHKAFKPRRSHTAEALHGKPGREDRAPPKKSPSDPKRGKRPPEERHSEGRESHSPRVHMEAKENAHRSWSGWEENKHNQKPSEEPHGKPGPQRHKPYNSSRPPTPRAPKHRLSVDANIQIPEALNSASKGDLLRRATKRFESKEISHDEFLAVAHQINQLFQYQEEKLQRSDSWEAPNEDVSGPHGQFPSKKKPLLSTPGSPRGRARDPMDDAELTYYEHKSKLRRTRVNRRPPGGDDWDGDMGSEDGDFEGPMLEGGPGTLARKYSRSPPIRPGERRSKERDEPLPPPPQPPAPMIEEYNHGKEFPPLKALPGLRFRRRADPRDSSEREWNSPLTERQREEHKSGYDAPARKFAPHLDPRRPERLPASSTVVLRNCPSPAGAEAPARPLPAPAFERERLSPLPQAEPVGSSPVPRFESPNSVHSDDGPLLLDPAAAHLPRHPAPPPRPILKPLPPGGPLAVARQHAASPGHTPPHDGGYHAPRYDGPMKGPPRPQPAGPHPPGRYDGPPRPGRYDDPGRYDEPGCYDGRFESGGPLPHNMGERFDGQGRYDGPPGPHGPMRGGGGGEGMGRFDGPPRPQGPGRFDGPMGPHPQGRFDGQGPMPHFDGPQRFDGMGPGGGGGGPGPMGFQQRPQMRFDGPQNQMGPMRFDGPGQMRFDGPGPMYDQGHPRFDGPQRFGPQMQPQLRPVGPQGCDSAGPQQQNFNMANHCFPDGPQFPGGPIPFPAQQGLPQGGGNFNMQPGPFNQAGGPQFYNPAGPAGNMHQPGNMMSAQPFHPQTPGPFGQPGAQFGAPESHFGQVDVNDLLSKLISTGIIAGAAPVQPEDSKAAGKELPPVPPVAPGPEEEEEDEQEIDDDVPDLTGFLIDTMKQRYESVVTKLFTGIQCYSCGMRFTSSQTDVYADHLDWHYRLNRSEKDVSRKVTHRRWYYTLTDWIEFEEIADLEERAKSLFFEKVNEEVVQKTQEAAKEHEYRSVRATADVVGESCEICQEAFEMYWEEEEEEWHLRDALRVEGKTYHPSCFEDYKNTSSFLDTTPSPNKVLTEHPLSAFIKTEPGEEDEAGTSCAVSSVKQEPEAEGGGGEVDDVKAEAPTMTEDVTPSAVS
ncbi:pre-mRNA cleavage complex 2 protein Pcf11 [Gadus morhua]|uniref:pre-mRNA cleavage complex 2 protein Pcf11 n=1 Tax=Gadus morhua TaxID=8049 RepID=UPI0011B7C329|nr:pre-mRNA cleavage complex 2 protein Pcf11 [Gadus morhua]